MDLDSTLSALADPTRRRIVTMLAEQPLSAGKLGEAFEISAPAMSRHLRVLRRSGMVDDQRADDDNRIRVYRLKAAPLDDLREWLEGLEAFWSDQLAAFKQHAEGNS